MQRPITVLSSALSAANGGGAVALVIVRHGLAAPGLDRQSGLGAVACLDLAFFIHRQHHGVRRGIEIEPDDVGELDGKAGIARALEGAQAVRLQLVRPPNGPHRTQRDAGRLGHSPAGPIGRLVRRCRASQRHHPRRGFRRERRLAGLAGFVVKQTLNPGLGKALLPAPHRRPADADALRHPLHRSPIRRGEHDARPLDVLARSVAVGHDHRQLLALRSIDNHTDRLSHGLFPPTWPSVAYPTAPVNPLNGSEH